MYLEMIPGLINIIGLLVCIIILIRIIDEL